MILWSKLDLEKNVYRCFINRIYLADKFYVTYEKDHSS